MIKMISLIWLVYHTYTSHGWFPDRILCIDTLGLVEDIHKRSLKRHNQHKALQLKLVS